MGLTQASLFDEGLEGVEYDGEFIKNNPIPAYCVKCKRRFEDGPQYKEAIGAPTLDNVSCFYCHGPLRPIDKKAYAERLTELSKHVVWRGIIFLLLLLTIPTFAAPYKRPRCTEPPTATPCLNSDGSIRRHTVEEWREIEKRRNEAAFFTNLIATVKQPLPWVIVGVCVVFVVILQRAKRRVERIEANFNEQRNIAIDATELADKYERELRRRKAA